MAEYLMDPYHSVFLDEVDSTNDEIKRRIGLGADSGMWVVAAKQTSGRGRRGRQWLSKEGNFFGSLYLKIDKSPQARSELSFVAALAVREALEEVSASRGLLTIKWPNDILYNGKKVAGLLLESTNNGTEGDIIIGIGINLAHAPDNTPYICTSICDETGLIITAHNLLPILSKCFDKYFQIWLSNGFTPIRELWMNKASGIAKPATVNLAEESFEGIFKGISAEGVAMIEMDDGTIRRVVAGDIFPTI